MNTNTPETDAETMDGSFKEQGCTITLRQWDYYKSPDGDVVMADFARRLERERDASRAQHAADVAELNARLIDRHADMMATIVMMRTEVRTAEAELSVSNGERDHYRRENAEMREAIKQCHSCISLFLGWHSRDLGMDHLRYVSETLAKCANQLNHSSPATSQEKS
jgi:hypothetical protein